MSNDLSASDQPQVNGSDQSIMKHASLVGASALRVQEQLPFETDMGDLLRSGTIGLLDATSDFNPNRNCDFRVYARFRIRAAILDRLRRANQISLDLRSLHAQVGEGDGRPAVKPEPGSLATEVAEPDDAVFR
jgi:RNA polymerase sigma factor FliA